MLLVGLNNLQRVCLNSQGKHQEDCDFRTKNKEELLFVEEDLEQVC